MTSQSCSWLDIYEEEKHALPQDVEQFLAFVRNRGGSLAYTAAKQLLAQKAVTATQHDDSRRDAPLQSITVASRSPDYFNAVSPAASSSESVYSFGVPHGEDRLKWPMPSVSLTASSSESVYSFGVPNIEDRLKWPMPSEIIEIEAVVRPQSTLEILQGITNEALKKENKELREAITALRQENSELRQDIRQLIVRQEMAIKEFQQENRQLWQEIQELKVRQPVVPAMLSPAERETVRWLQEELPWWVKESTWEQRRKPVAVPVFALRFTHRFVNASLAFGDEHGNPQENILKLYEQMFRGRVKLSEIEPLVVKLPETCGDDVGIRSRNNRRLLALRMLQSSRLDECLKVPCYINTHQDYEQNPKFREWFDRGDDGTSGWSIKSREGKSKHRCVAIFNNADAAVKGLENLLQRASEKDLPNEHGISHVQALLKLIKRRPVAPGCGDDDEETLTFASLEDHDSTSNAAWRGWRGPGGWSWGHSNWAQNDDWAQNEV